MKGVAGAQGSGASIVSFDKDAFKSFGKERGANAPVSERAAFAYTTSLNMLLERGSRQRIRIGDATTLFWAEAAGNEAKAREAEDLFSILFSDPPTDEQEAAEVSRQTFGNRTTAVRWPKSNLKLDDEDTRFFVLGLAPNAARLSIRFWYEDSIGTISRRIGEHWRDLHLEPAPWRTPPVCAAPALRSSGSTQGRKHPADADRRLDARNPVRRALSTVVARRRDYPNSYRQ